MKLLKQKSERLDKNGEPFEDLVLVWFYNDKVYDVRIRPFFASDYKKLYSMAETVPTGEPLEKYL